MKGVRVLVGVWMVLALFGGAGAAGYTDGVMGNLPALKDFTAGRQSSYDPSGGNADGRQDWPIQPGETREMARVEGAGAITHIWVTIASKDEGHLKNLVLRMYWDGEEAPSVECPIGDFFGLGHGQYYQYDCLPIQIGTNKGLNCFWRMPFGNGARVTVTNDGPIECGAFYYYVDYLQCESVPALTGRFHAQYRQAYPCPEGANYVILEAAGRGHYVGCNLSIRNRADGWWGEGDDMIYVDGEEEPSFCGTGSEDYFCGAWCYGPAFSDLYLGCPLRGEHRRDAYWNVYRYHIEDPIPFRESLKVTIEHGHANDRSDDFSSVAYWYQAEPHGAFPVLSAAADRLPAMKAAYVEEGALEGEGLVELLGSSEVTIQEMSRYDDEWSDGRQAWFRPPGPKTYAVWMPAEGDEAGDFTLELWYTQAPDYGTCELWLNGDRVGAWDGYHADGVVRQKTSFPVTLKDGENGFEIRVSGKHDSSTGYMAGIDCYRLTPR